MVSAERRTQTEAVDPRAERTQLDLLRKATVARRATLAVSLSQTVIRLAREAIRRQNPGLADRDALLYFAAIHYGPETAERLRVDLSRRLK